MGQRDRDAKGSLHLERALAIVEAMGTADTVIVPAKPSSRMLTAGARSGHISEEIAAEIYHAMIRAGGR